MKKTQLQAEKIPTRRNGSFQNSLKTNLEKLDSKATEQTSMQEQQCSIIEVLSYNQYNYKQGNLKRRAEVALAIAKRKYRNEKRGHID